VAASQILDERMPGDRHLRSPIGLESAHGSQPSLELTVIGLDRVVRVLLDVTPRHRQEFVDHTRVDRCGVGDDLVRDHLERPERPGEESAGC
jgi:hypothetical protein